MSGRVVNTSTWSIPPAGSARRKRNCRPRLLPIQFSCISRTFSGQSSRVLQPLEQLVGELGDLQKPLRELAPLDRSAGAPALAVDHLLVGEHGHVDRVPIDLALLAIDEAGVEQVEEQRLLVAVISGVAGRELAAPVEREADLLQLLAHRRDVGPGPFARMDLALHRRILGRHSERVPAHRVEHFVALHPAIARDDVAHRVVADVAHVDAPRGIGEHLQHVSLGLGAIAVGREAALLLPPRLPAAVGGGRVETPACHALAYPRTAARRRSRARVRMMSSSFCTVAAETGASTQAPF